MKEFDIVLLCLPRTYVYKNTYFEVCTKCPGVSWFPVPDVLLQAKAFLASYSGQTVKTLSALCVTNLETGRVSEGVHEATVFWKDIPTHVVDGVVARGLIMSSASGSRRIHTAGALWRHRLVW